MSTHFLSCKKVIRANAKRSVKNLIMEGDFVFRFTTVLNAFIRQISRGCVSCCRENKNIFNFRNRRVYPFKGSA